jgi:hypothetical protein
MDAPSFLLMLGAWTINPRGATGSSSTGLKVESEVSECDMIAIKRREKFFCLIAIWTYDE